MLTVKSVQTHPFSLDEASAISVVRAVSRIFDAKIFSKVAKPSICGTSDASPVEQQLATQDTPTLDWKRKSNVWNLFQREHAQQIKDGSIVARPATAAYEAAPNEKRTELKQSCARLDQFPPARTSTEQCRFGDNKRSIQQKRAARMIQGFQNRLADASMSDAATDLTIAEPTTTRIVSSSLANPSNMLVEDVMTECRIRLRAFSAARKSEEQAMQETLQAWHASRDDQALAFLQRNAPPLQPMLEDFVVRPSSTHQVRSIYVRVHNILYCKLVLCVGH